MAFYQAYDGQVYYPMVYYTPSQFTYPPVPFNFGNNCQFVHGHEELRPTLPHPKYKTRMCNKYNTPRGCQYGEKCHFRHPDDPLPEFMNSGASSRGTLERSDSHQSNSSVAGLLPPPPPPQASRKKSRRSENRPPSKSSNSNSVPTSIHHTSAADKEEKKKSKAAKHAEKERAKQAEREKREDKDKECLIKLSMYHRFENYVGKHRKTGQLKRSNSCNTVGVYTYQRFVNMQKLVKSELDRLKIKNGKAASSNKRPPKTPLTALLPTPSIF